MRSASSPRSLAQTLRDKSRHAPHRSPSHQPPTPPSMVPGPKDFLAMHQERLQFEAHQMDQQDTQDRQDQQDHTRYMISHIFIFHGAKAQKMLQSKIFDSLFVRPDFKFQRYRLQYGFVVLKAFQNQKTVLLLDNFLDIIPLFGTLEHLVNCIICEYFCSAMN